MPPIIALLPTIAAVAGLAGTGISVGEALSNSGGGGSASSASKIQQQLASQEAAQQRTQAVLSATPDAIERTGGSLTDAGTQSFINTLAGYGPGGTSSGGTSPASSSGNPYEATLATLGAPGQEGQGGQQGNIQDILAKLTSFQGGGGQGNVSGGAQPQPLSEATGRFELSAPFVT